MHKLIIEDDEGRTTVVPLVRDELSIGRQEGNAIRLTERYVSRQHARLLKTNGAVVIEDLASYTGVRVNGIRIEAPTPLREGDQVSIGDYKLSVRADGVVENRAPSAQRMPAFADATASSSTNSAAATNGASLEGAPDLAGDGAPTIPVRTLVESTRAAERAKGQPPRLVVVTTSLGGMEFRLDRPSLVIGRTEENDIILNHPSISRHHAKIVRDGERYTVVDLQSANGVRVGGETYERVDVQPGDVIELGHVKLRLVGAGEAWSYDPREFLPRSRRLLKVGAIGGGVVVAAVALLLATHKSGPSGEPAPAAVAQPPVAAGPTPAEYFARATADVSEEKWDDAVTSLDLLLSTAPNDDATKALRDSARTLKRKVDLERRSAELYSSFDEAAKSKEPDVAISRFDAIPTASIYKSRAEAAMPEVKEQFLAAHLDLADAARGQNNCSEVRAEVEKITQVDPENAKAQEILKACRTRPTARVAVAAPAALPAAARAPASPRAAGARTRAAGAGSNALDEFAPSQEPPADAAELVRQARAAWLHQQCGQAIDLSRRALKMKPGVNDAHQIIAVCSCSTRDKDGATRSYLRLDERSRSMVRSICAKYGVELGE
jgi:pSer/pThr/pTyr-binding forkhead associated (FHA) protein